MFSLFIDWFPKNNSFAKVKQSFIYQKFHSERDIKTSCPRALHSIYTTLNLGRSQRHIKSLHSPSNIYSQTCSFHSLLSFLFWHSVSLPYLWRCASPVRLPLLFRMINPGQPLLQHSSPTTLWEAYFLSMVQLQLEQAARWRPVQPFWIPLRKTSTVSYSTVASRLLRWPTTNLMRISMEILVRLSQSVLTVPPFSAMSEWPVSKPGGLHSSVKVGFGFFLTRINCDLVVEFLYVASYIFSHLFCVWFWIWFALSYCIRDAYRIQIGILICLYYSKQPLGDGRNKTRISWCYFEIFLSVMVSSGIIFACESWSPPRSSTFEVAPKVPADQEQNKLENHIDVIISFSKKILEFGIWIIAKYSFKHYDESAQRDGNS